jgi:hypothetical protein
MASDPGESDASVRGKGPVSYANYFKVRMNPFELLMEFGQFYTEDAEPLIHTRVVTAPPFGKVFLDLLTDSIHAFEAEHGLIERPHPRKEKKP